MIKTVFLKEVGEIVRDGRLRLLGALVLILTVCGDALRCTAVRSGLRKPARTPANVRRSSGSHRVRKIRMSQGIMWDTRFRADKCRNRGGPRGFAVSWSLGKDGSPQT